MMAKEYFIQPRFCGSRFDESTLPLSAANDKRKSIKEIEYQDIVPHYALSAAIDDLNNLRDGWLERRGIAPQRANLQRLSEDLVDVFPPVIQYPAVVPTEEGNVSLEWIITDARVELEVNFSENRLELYATEIETDAFVEESFALEDWAGALGRITSLLQR